MKLAWTDNELAWTDNELMPASNDLVAKQQQQTNAEAAAKFEPKT